MTRVRSNRRLQISKDPDAVRIRFSWFQSFVRGGMFLLCAAAVIILLAEHGGKPLPLQDIVGLFWAALIIGLIFTGAINAIEITVSDEISMRSTPVSVFPPRRFARAEVKAVYHWMRRFKGDHFHVAIQTECPVHTGQFDTEEEARVVAETIAARLGVQCLHGMPGPQRDWVALRRIIAVAACAAAPLVVVLLIELIGA